jgi:hypothetical protein
LLFWHWEFHDFSTSSFALFVSLQFGNCDGAGEDARGTTEELPLAAEGVTKGLLHRVIKVDEIIPVPCCR